MSASEAKRKYDIQYAKDKLKRIPLDVQKDKYDEIKAAADAAGEPVNGYIKIAIDMRMENDKSFSNSFPAYKPHLPESSAATPKAKPEKHYKPFTESDAAKVDLQKLLTDVRYQLSIMENFGSDILSDLLETARHQSANSE